MKTKVLTSALTAVLALGYFAYQTFAPAPVVESAVTVLSEDASVHFLNVGQGDCALFIAGDQAVLIDAGIASASDHIISYLQEQGVSELTAAVATHPHADHIGAMDEILLTFPTQTLYVPDCSANTQTYERMLDAVESTETVMVIPEIGDQIVLDAGVTFTLLSPDPADSYSETNDYSLVYMVQAEDTRILMMGDAEAPVEAQLLDSGFDLSCDIIKLGHHGSSSSSTADFIAATNAELAIISCGLDNTYGHPHAETLETLAEYGISAVYTYDGDYAVSITPA